MTRNLQSCTRGVFSPGRLSLVGSFNPEGFVLVGCVISACLGDYLKVSVVHSWVFR